MKNKKLQRLTALALVVAAVVQILSLARAGQGDRQ